jgi:DNA repair protein RecO (recombination protein O)
MAVEKIKGLVIKAKNINENDKYLTVLCEEYGKIFFKAAGVRNYKSKNIASAQPFAYSEFTIFKAPSFIRMNEAQVIEGFYGIRTDLEALALAVYLSDIAGIICISESGDDGHILRLLLNTLHVISNKKMPNKIIKAVFELRALTKSGFMPGLDECEVCSRGRPAGGNNGNNGAVIFFDIAGGNIICGDCVEKTDPGAKLVRITHDLLSALRFITAARDEKLFSFALSGDIASELAIVCEKYLLEQTGINTDSLKYYKSHEKT